jgi:hypothetical protein
VKWTRRAKHSTIAVAVFFGVVTVAVVAYRAAPLTAWFDSAWRPKSEYWSEHVGLAFKYPSAYLAALSHENDGKDAWHMVTVSRATDKTTAAVGASTAKITISVFDNGKQLTPTAWVDSSKHAARRATALQPSRSGADARVSYVDEEGTYHSVVAHGNWIYYYSVSPAHDEPLMRTFELISSTVSYPQQ